MEYPVLQLHVKDPSVLLHSLSVLLHALLVAVHSSTSTSHLSPCHSSLQVQLPFTWLHDEVWSFSHGHVLAQLSPNSPFGHSVK